MRSVWSALTFAMFVSLPGFAQSPEWPPNWNVMNAAEQAQWLSQNNPNANYKQFIPAPQRRASRSRYVAPSWYSRSQKEAEIRKAVPYTHMLRTSPGTTLQQYNDAVQALAAKELGIAPPPRTYAPSVYTPTYPNERGSRANRYGGTTFYSGSVSGTATSLPPFEFYNFSNGVRGTTTHLGSFQFYNFTDRRGSSTNGSTTTLGQFQFHNFDNGLSGSSTTIGGTTFHNFNNGKNCTTTTIGATQFTNCY